MVLVGLFVSAAQGQTRQEVKAEAERQLTQMTPEEIERKIKELGLTKEEATKKAAELGVSLEQFLSKAKLPGEAKETEAVAGPEPALPKGETKPLPADTVQKPVIRKPPPLGASGLPFFGYDIFSSVPAAFEPTAVGPVDPEYVIGPEDVLRISVWGQVEFQNQLTVDKEGRIFIPTVGQVLVSGFTLQKAYESLLKQMSRSYSGLVSTPPTVWLDVTLARLRPKRVFIMGEVAQPGGYTVSSYATVFNSLYSVGGPTVHGSLRDVRVIRGDKVISRVDLYSYLTGAEETKDIRIQNNDIIFIPVRGKTVTIKGEVQRPAIYELKEDEQLSSLLQYCGGLLPTAYMASAQIDRVKPFKERTGGVEDRIVVDFNLGEALISPSRAVKLVDADTVNVFSVLEEKRNFVTIFGSVWRPGRYELSKIRTLRDLITAAEGVQPKTFLDMAHVVRLNSDLITRSIIPFNLGRVMEDAAYDQKLQPRDEVLIYSTEVTEVKEKFVTIRGEVKKPGRYPLRTRMTLQDLVLIAGGYTEATELLQAEVARIAPGGFSGDSLAMLLHPKLPVEFMAPARTALFDSASITRPGIEGQFLLQHRDEVLIRPDPNYKLQQNVTIEGDITYPGVYAIEHRGERLSEFLARAGGPTKTSYLGGAQFYREGRRLLLNFVKAYYDKNEIHDVVMLSGDRIVVPPRPYTVSVNGEVNKPGLLSFIPGDDVSDYIDRAGGLTDSASYALFVKPTGESRRVNFGLFRSNPEVAEGSAITVLKLPPPPPEQKGEELATTIKDVFAIVTSAATIAFLIWQVTK
jgi:protein involved in polysaccharide export with SLBB domain